jgi:hypothetical protein
MNPALDSSRHVEVAGSPLRLFDQLVAGEFRNCNSDAETSRPMWPSRRAMARASIEALGRLSASIAHARARAWRASPGATEAAVDHFAARLLGPFAARAGEVGGGVAGCCWRFFV